MIPTLLIVIAACFMTIQTPTRSPTPTRSLTSTALKVTMISKIYLLSAVFLRQKIGLFNTLKIRVLRLVIPLSNYSRLEIERQARKTEYIFDVIEVASLSLDKRLQGELAVNSSLQVIE